MSHTKTFFENPRSHSLLLFLIVFFSAQTCNARAVRSQRLSLEAGYPFTLAPKTFDNVWIGGYSAKISYHPFCIEGISVGAALGYQLFKIDEGQIPGLKTRAHFIQLGATTLFEWSLNPDIAIIPSADIGYSWMFYRLEDVGFKFDDSGLFLESGLSVFVKTSDVLSLGLTGSIQCVFPEHNIWREEGSATSSMNLGVVAAWRL